MVYPQSTTTLKKTSFKDKHEAEKMAELIEAVMGNPLTKIVLRYCTKRDKCGRRVELALQSFAGKKPKMCLNCRISAFFIKNLLNFFANKWRIKKKDLIKSLLDPMWRKGLSSVLEGIAIYGPKKPFTSYAPFLVVWNITKSCNLACKHCYEDAHIKAQDELTTEQALKAVDDMAKAGVAYIAISGGEPLVRKDLFQVLNRIKKKEMASSIATNATLLTKETAKKLKKAGCIYVQISLDGAKPETHNKFRGKNSFEKTIQGIKNAVREGIVVGIAATITKYNLKEVPKLIDLTEKLGADIFMHYNFIPTGRGKEIVKLDISPKEREELMEFLLSQIGKRKINLLSTAPQYSRVCTSKSKLSLTHFDIFGQEEDFGEEIKFLAEFVGGCGAGRLYFALEPNGDILPCVFIQKRLGNIKEDDLVKLWNTHPDLKKLREREKFSSSCGTCEHRNICGGCRARAYNYFNDLTECDPGCINNQEQWEKIQKSIFGKK